MKRIAVDIGGTFTDCFIAWGDRQVEGKALTSHHNLALGFLEAVADAATQLGVDPAEVIEGSESIRYGTTLGTNALIERKGPRIGVLVTMGFESMIRLSRGRGYGEGLPRHLQVDLPRATRPHTAGRSRPGDRNTGTSRLSGRGLAAAGCRAGAPAGSPAGRSRRPGLRGLVDQFGSQPAARGTDRRHHSRRISLDAIRLFPGNPEPSHLAAKIRVRADDVRADLRLPPRTHVLRPGQSGGVAAPAQTAEALTADP